MTTKPAVVVSQTPVILDTSVCVQLLRGKNDKVAAMVHEAIRERRAVVCEPVIFELLQGARNQKQISAIDQLVEVCRDEPTTRADWLAAGNARAKHLAKGITISPLDYLIAAVASRLTLAILTIDLDFKQLDAQVELVDSQLG